jgi:ABC-type amino acid transport substrate-binding protein
MTGGRAMPEPMTDRARSRSFVAVGSVRASLFTMVFGALALCGAAGALAQQAAKPVWSPTSPTLKKIDAAGVVKIGYRENSPPFAFLDAKRKPIGYSLDLCETVVDAIAAELGKEIRVEFLPVTPENRFDLVTSGAIDLECGSTTNNAERRKTVAFSPTMFVTGTKLLVKRGSGIRSLAGLDGKTVVLTRGTVHETAVPRIAQRRNLKINFVFAGDHQESLQMLASGKADAFANDDVQLSGIVAATGSGADYRIVGENLTYADYALMFRKDDPDFAEVIAGAFRKLAGSREIVAIYDRWFVKALPSGVRLDLPMSPHLEELFQVQGLPGD